MHNLSRGKNYVGANLGSCVTVNKTAQSKQSPTRRKFAQSPVTLLPANLFFPFTRNWSVKKKLKTKLVDSLPPTKALIDSFGAFYRLQAEIGSEKQTLPKFT
jgi:hypothetical protein